MALAHKRSESTNIAQKESGLSNTLEEAVERVYRQYGADLPAFFRDVQQQLSLKREVDSKYSQRFGLVIDRSRR